MTTLTLLTDNDKTLNHLKNILKLMKGVTLIPTTNHEIVSQENKKTSI